LAAKAYGSETGNPSSTSIHARRVWDFKHHKRVAGGTASLRPMSLENPLNRNIPGAHAVPYKLSFA
jgi:hypothetical protein